MKGYIYTLEVVIAISVIALSMIFIFGSPPVKPELELGLIKHQGFDALEFLDNKGLLRQLNDTDIEDNLRQLLPGNLQLSLDDSDLPDRTIIVVDYYLANYRESYIGRNIRLYLWEA